MPAGYLAKPLGLKDEDENDPQLYGWSAGAEAPSNFQVSLGFDNPYMDLLRPGSAGGVGYYQICSQLQILDEGSQSMCLNLQAFTPAGTQFGGLPDGPAAVSAALAWFHDLGKGIALQGFIADNLRAVSEYRPIHGTRMHAFYGLALQYPLPFLPEPPEDKKMFIFAEGLGTVRYQDGEIQARPDVILGIQYHLDENCWLSLGGTERHGLISCLWQY